MAEGWTSPLGPLSDFGEGEKAACRPGDAGGSSHPASLASGGEGGRRSPAGEAEREWYAAAAVWGELKPLARGMRREATRAGEVGSDGPGGGRVGGGRVRRPHAVWA